MEGKWTIISANELAEAKQTVKVLSRVLSLYGMEATVADVLRKEEAAIEEYVVLPEHPVPMVGEPEKLNIIKAYGCRPTPPENNNG